ncbi:MAG TPA: hypothetical protein DCE47_21415 [Planctomycetaceae bacterium]|nr:hypothetical protein [Planctomycetaceae bacterium]
MKTWSGRGCGTSSFEGDSASGREDVVATVSVDGDGGIPGLQPQNNSSSTASDEVLMVVTCRRFRRTLARMTNEMMAVR